MRIFLVRHAETVDNVAGLYAGSRDSALTAHGVLQTQRLAASLASQQPVSHLFASNLQRAVKTAEAVRDACRAHEEQLKTTATTEEESQPVLVTVRDVDVVQVVELREKDFGSGEGEKYGVVAGAGERRPHVGAESAEALRVRADRFIDEHLFPLFGSEESAAGDGIGVRDKGREICCVVVSHGILLSTLFRALCARLPPDTITVATEAQRSSSSSFTSSTTAPILPAWSNTGYVEMVLTATTTSSPSSSSEDGTEQLHPLIVQARKMHILKTNCITHLVGLKKTRGGIGSAKFDDKQKTIDSFFSGAAKKKRKSDAMT